MEEGREASSPPSEGEKSPPATAKLEVLSFNTFDIKQVTSLLLLD
jgi:hypothetical protein